MLRTRVAGLDLPCCVYNAAGPRTNTQEQLQMIAASRSGAVLCKSATLEKRQGNLLPRYLELDDEWAASHGGGGGDGGGGGGAAAACVTSINSEGLPNAGIDYYISAELVAAVTDSQYAGKPYIVSISGLKLEANLEMVRRAAAAEGVSAIELNLACPNVVGKPVVAYDFEQMQEVLERVFALDLHGTPLGIKLAPYFDVSHFQRVAEIVNSFPGVAFVVCTNTMGNGLVVDADLEMAAIASNNGFGGLGGGHIKYTALANVRKFFQLLRPDIQIVGVGGVATGRDAFELILCGASAVQVGTAHKKEGPACFGRIAGELEGIMEAKGYTSIEDFRGKLRPYSRELVREQRQQQGGGRKRRQRASAAGLTGVSAQHAAVLRACIFALLAVVAYLMRKVYQLQQEQQ